MSNNNSNGASSTTTVGESASLLPNNLRGDDRGFGAISSGTAQQSDALGPLPPPRPARQSLHEREMSTATEISWLSLLFSKNKDSSVGDSSNRSEKKGKKLHHHRAWGILFDHPDAVFVSVAIAMHCISFIIHLINNGPSHVLC